ncbi:hypothetical protein BpHYR1_038738 [Brachionus plicatilis]|uniref:Uncharacterized protein n=1 Tax=Brachionus plicatilis TaxID=10195 RepID=A0A3M7RKW7_BRAPC|nr:hypothetical protein BpHYR1_038738 [Brachionus plicatilis]
MDGAQHRRPKRSMSYVEKGKDRVGLANGPTVNTVQGTNTNEEDVFNHGKRKKLDAWQSRKAALEDFCEFDPSRMRFGMKIHIMDWPLKKIQEEIEKSRKRLAHRLDSDEDVPP